MSAYEEYLLLNIYFIKVHYLLKACFLALQVLYDLLSAAPGSVDSLQIVEEGGSTVVKGLTQIQVASEEEALALLFEGTEQVNLAHLCCC